MEHVNRKMFMLDSTVLVHDPLAFTVFDEHEVIIPTITINALKELSGQPGERGASARDALRNIMNEFRCENKITLSHVKSRRNLKSTAEQADYDYDWAAAGEIQTDDYEFSPFVTIGEKGGTLSIYPASEKGGILGAAKESGATLITKDTATRLNAIACGIDVEDYRHDKTTDDTSRFYTGRSIIYLSGKEVSEIAKNYNGIDFPDGVQIYGTEEKSGAEIEREKNYKLSENEFLVIKNYESENGGGTLGRYSRGRIVPLHYASSHPFDIIPRNVGQIFAIEALMTPCSSDNPNEDVAPLVILKGPAGTAKTFLSMACGLEQTYNSPVYRSMLVTRQSSLLDETPGYLPGDEFDKVSPLLRCVFDNVEHLMSPKNKGTINDAAYGASAVEELISRGVLSIQSFSYFRGRSLADTFVVLDEAQNADAHQMFTLATRNGVNSKLTILGDIDQIDAPFLDKYNNGLTFISERMKGSRLCWQVTFTEDECERSDLATEAIRRLGHSN